RPTENILTPFQGLLYGESTIVSKFPLKFFRNTQSNNSGPLLFQKQTGPSRAKEPVIRRRRLQPNRPFTESHDRMAAPNRSRTKGHRTHLNPAANYLSWNNCNNADVARFFAMLLGGEF